MVNFNKQLSSHQNKAKLKYLIHYFPWEQKHSLFPEVGSHTEIKKQHIDSSSFLNHSLRMSRKGVHVYFFRQLNDISEKVWKDFGSINQKIKQRLDRGDDEE